MVDNFQISSQKQILFVKDLKHFCFARYQELCTLVFSACGLSFSVHSTADCQHTGWWQPAALLSAYWQVSPAWGKCLAQSLVHGMYSENSFEQWRRTAFTIRFILLCHVKPFYLRMEVFCFCFLVLWTVEIVLSQRLCLEREKMFIWTKF